MQGWIISAPARRRPNPFNNLRPFSLLLLNLRPLNLRPLNLRQFNLRQFNLR